MARWFSVNVLEAAATGAVLVAAVTVIFRGSNAGPSGSSWTQLDSTTVATGASSGVGDEDARQAVMIFSDFECPFCRIAAEGVIPWLRAEYVDPGKVRLVFKHFPLDQLHPDARRLARLAACASLQNNPWDVHQLLYRASPASDVSADSLAALFQLDAERLTGCSSGVGRRIVEQDIDDGLRLGVTGTPTFVLGTLTNGVIVAAVKRSGVVDQASLARALGELEKREN